MRKPKNSHGLHHRCLSRLVNSTFSFHKIKSCPNAHLVEKRMYAHILQSNKIFIDNKNLKHEFFLGLITLSIL
jgi:hypothetical protein